MHESASLAALWTLWCVRSISQSGGTSLPHCSPCAYAHGRAIGWGSASRGSAGASFSLPVPKLAAMGDYSTPYTAAMPPARQAQPQEVLRQQDQIIRQQDQSLEQISRSVGTLHRMGQEIRGEISQQNHLLDDLENGVDQTREALVAQQSRLKRLIKRTKDCKLYICIGARAHIGLLTVASSRAFEFVADHLGCARAGARAFRHRALFLDPRMALPSANTR